MHFHPARAQQLLAYSGIIFRLAREVEGNIWQHYDRAFRQAAAVNPFLQWVRREPDTWLASLEEATRPKRPPSDAQTPQGRSQPSPPLRHAYNGTGASATVQHAALPTSASCARAHPIVPRIAPFCNPIQPLTRLPSLLGQTRTSSSNLLHSQAGDWPASASHTHS